MSASDLDTKIDLLRAAVDAGDESTIDAQLRSIEHELAPMNPLMRGMTYAHVQSVLRRPAEAAAVLEDLLQLMPEASLIHHQLGRYRRAAGDVDGALLALTRATELDAARTDAWIERGIVLDAKGEPELAIASYRHAILRAPTEVDAWRNLGNALAALAAFDEAIEAYRTACKLAPDDDTLAFLVASAHQAKGELDAANAALPPALRVELGEVIEVRAQARGLELRCRFHADAAGRPLHEHTARGLLDASAAAIATAEASPLALERAFAVQRDDHWLLCDPDAITPDRPHRFFDATRLIQRAVR